MPLFGVTIAKPSPEDERAIRLLDMFEAEYGLVSYESTETSRGYDIEAPTAKLARREVANRLREIGGSDWPDYLAIARGDDP
ncbi:MAG: hypothetical protein JO027_07615 [Solirubrobacterales bacterium]|nr:hypothetical protein [Solirubrobacterales bacterium]